jgi:hypothetical protein
MIAICIRDFCHGSNFFNQGLSMRPGQNKRMRGRNNRKGPSPLSRTYESNGPDVKIRGTAQHVAEKYLQLARDAQSSGDPVMAENLLQHAEHYFRIIAAAQTAQQQAQIGFGRNGEELDDGDEDDDFVALPDRFASPFERAPQQQPMPQQPQNMGQMGYSGQPQPYFERPAFAPEANERQADRPERQERNQERNQDRNYERGANANGERQERQSRNDRRFGQQGDRQQGQGRNRFRDQPQRFDAGSNNQEQPRVDFDAVNSALPAFITAPTRPAAALPVSGGNAASFSQPEIDDTPLVVRPDLAQPAAENIAAPGDDDGENRFHLRTRRRRRPRAEASAEGGDAAPLPETSSAD